MASSSNSKKIINLKDLSVEDLKIISIEVNKELSKKTPKSPVSIINEWRQISNKRYAKYDFFDQKRPDRIIGCLSIHKVSHERDWEKDKSWEQ